MVDESAFKLCRAVFPEVNRQNDPADLADQVAVATSSVAVQLVVIVMLQVSIMLSMLLVFFASTVADMHCSVPFFVC